MTDQEQTFAAIAAIAVGVGVVGWWLATVLFVAWRGAVKACDIWKDSSNSNFHRWQDAVNRDFDSWKDSSDEHENDADCLREDFIAHLKGQLAAMQAVILPNDPESDA